MMKTFLVEREVLSARGSWPTCWPPAQLSQQLLEFTGDPLQGLTLSPPYQPTFQASPPPPAQSNKAENGREHVEGWPRTDIYTE